MAFSPPFLNVKDFGAVGDDSHDDFPAFQAALNLIEQSADPLGTGRVGGTVFVPPGVYRLSQPLRLTRCTVLQGAGTFSSALVFLSSLPQAQSPGIVVDGPDGDGSIIRDLRILRLDAPGDPRGDEEPIPEPTSSGIVLRRTACIQNCNIKGFEHDGIHINPDAGGADNWQIINCFSGSNGRHGLFVQGGDDTHGGCAINLHCQLNRAWGIYERLEIGGNTYLACYSDENRRENKEPNDLHPDFGGAFRTTSPGGTSGFSTFLGCSFEGELCMLQWGTIMIGGSHNGLILRDPQLVGNHPLETTGVEPDVIEGGTFATVQSLRVRGGISVNARIVNFAVEPQPITLEDGDVFVDASVGDVSLTLPPLDASDPPQDAIDRKFHYLRIVGRAITIKRIDGKSDRRVTVSVSLSRTETIDGAPSVLLENPFDWVTVVASAAAVGTSLQMNWHVIGYGHGKDVAKG